MIIKDDTVVFELYGKTFEFDKISFALWKLSESFELKIKEDAEKLHENQKNGQVLKVTNDGYNAEGKEQTSYHVLPWAWDNIDTVEAYIKNIGNFVSKNLIPFGITLNPNWNQISAPFVDKIKKIREILGKVQSDAFANAAQQAVNKYQNAYNEELSRDYGLSFGILSSSLTAHLVYAAQATAKEMKDRERAENFASSVAGNPMEQLLIAVFNAIHPLYIQTVEPAMLQVLAEYYSYIVSLFANELGYNYETIASQFSIDNSIEVLNTSSVSKDAIFDALRKNPHNGVVMGYAITNSLVDDELVSYAYDTSPLFLSRVKNWAISKLTDVYDAGKLFNKPIINDDNKHIINGLMSFYSVKYKNLKDCKDWQDILTTSYLATVGKHITDFTELVITISNPTEFDKRARANRKFNFTDEIKKTFVLLHDELHFSGAYTTASFLELQSPITISKFDEKVRSINEKLSIRSVELAKQDEINRKKQEREEKCKEKTTGISMIIIACFLFPVGILLFAIESFFLGLVELVISVPLFITGCKKISAWKEYSAIADKEIRERKAQERKEFVQTNKKKFVRILVLIVSIAVLTTIFFTVCLPIINYGNAQNAYDDGDYGKAAILFAKADWYKDASSLCDDAWSKIQNQNRVDGNTTSVAAIKNNGKVVAAGTTAEENNALAGWVDIVAIAKGSGHTVGLKSDGTVVACGNNDDGECNVEDWTDIVAISTADDYTLGLKNDGTVLATGSNEHGQCNVTQWKDIISIVAGAYHSVGLKSDGTVVATAVSRGSHAHTPDYGQSNVSSWKDIIYIDAGEYQTVGLKKDGTVVSTEIDSSVWSVWQPYYFYQDKVSNWNDIVKVCVERYHIVGLKKDGTLVCNFIPSDNWRNEGQCNVDGISNVVDITVGSGITIAIKKDGTAVKIGMNYGFSNSIATYKEWYPSEWSNLKTN